MSSCRRVDVGAAAAVRAWTRHEQLWQMRRDVAAAPEVVSGTRGGAKVDHASLSID